MPGDWVRRNHEQIEECYDRVSRLISKQWKNHDHRQPTNTEEQWKQTFFYQIRPGSPVAFQWQLFTKHFNCALQQSRTLIVQRFGYMVGNLEGNGAACSKIIFVFKIPYCHIEYKMFGCDAWSARKRTKAPHECSYCRLSM